MEASGIVEGQDEVDRAVRKHVIEEGRQLVKHLLTEIGQGQETRVKRF